MPRQFLLGQHLNQKGVDVYTLFEIVNGIITGYESKTFSGGSTLKEVAKEILSVRKKTKSSSGFSETALTLTSIPRSIFIVETDSSLPPVIETVKDEIIKEFHAIYKKVGKY